jgi:thiol-disulfide isomerase/thioredoxin
MGASADLPAGQCVKERVAGAGASPRWGRAAAVAVWLCAASAGPVPAAERAAAPDASSPAAPPSAGPRSAPLATILAEARASGAPLVLVNVWATWCDPCREELPDLLRVYRDHRGAGLRLVMISADDTDAGAQVAAVLSAATARAGIGHALDGTSYLKQDDDMKLIDGLDPRWSGALPATFLFDAGGRRVRSWLAPVTFADVDAEIRARLSSGGLTKSSDGVKRGTRRKP